MNKIFTMPSSSAVFQPIIQIENIIHSSRLSCKTLADHAVCLADLALIQFYDLSVVCHKAVDLDFHVCRLSVYGSRVTGIPVALSLKLQQIGYTLVSSRKFRKVVIEKSKS